MAKHSQRVAFRKGHKPRLMGVASHRILLQKRCGVYMGESQEPKKNSLKFELWHCDGMIRRQLPKRSGFEKQNLIGHGSNGLLSRNTVLLQNKANSNWLVVSNIFYFHPYLGKWSNLTNIFQMGWNHQLAKDLGMFPVFVFVNLFDVLKDRWKRFCWDAPKMFGASIEPEKNKASSGIGKLQQAITDGSLLNPWLYIRIVQWMS